MSNTTLIAGLRELADWLEAHEDADLPEFTGFVYATIYDKDARERLGRFARSLDGRAEERVRYGSVQIAGQFGDAVEVQLSAPAGCVGGEKVERVQYEPILPERIAA